MNHQKVFILLRSLDVFGGTEIQTLNLGKALVELDFDVSLILYFHMEPELQQFFEKEGIKVVFLNIKEEKGLLHLLKSIKDFLRLAKPDIVHVQYMNPGLIPIIAAKLAGSRVIIGQIHQPATHYSWLHKLFVKTAGLLSDFFISVSLNTQQSWFGKKHLLRIGQSIPTNFTIYNSLYYIFQPSEEKLKRRNEAQTLKIAVIGRLRWEKGQLFALEAYKAIYHDRSDVELHFVGVGPDLDLLKDTCKEWGIEDQVYFHGQLPPVRLNEFYNDIHLVLVPSRFEAFGLTAIEAMLFGIPVIASNVDGLKEVVDNGINGFLVEFGDVTSLTDRINLLLENRDNLQEMGLRGKEKVLANFAFEPYKAIIYDFYSRL
jgi:L-malate glycosyltransferase